MRKSVILQGIAVVGFVMSAMACSVTKTLPVQEMPEEFSLTGQWAITNDTKMMDEVMFDFRNIESETPQLKVWGQSAELNGIRKSNDQFIFHYNVDQEDGYSVLITVLGEDKIKLSRVQSSIKEFQPLGKLGEKVYHLQKRSQGDLKLIAKAVK